MQYVGKASDDFHFRWNNYKYNKRKYARKKACMQQHFSSEGHSGFLDDVSVIFIHKTDPKDPNERDTTGDIPLKQWHLKV